MELLDCPPGTYVFNVPNQPIRCLPCQDGEYSFGGFTKHNEQCILCPGLPSLGGTPDCTSAFYANETTMLYTIKEGYFPVPANSNPEYLVPCNSPACKEQTCFRECQVLPIQNTTACTVTCSRDCSEGNYIYLYIIRKYISMHMIYYVLYIYRSTSISDLVDLSIHPSIYTSSS